MVLCVPCDPKNSNSQVADKYSRHEEEADRRIPASQNKIPHNQFIRQILVKIMLSKVFNKRIRDMSALFNGHYVEIKCLYAFRFHEIPCVDFIGEMDPSRAFAHINATCHVDIVEVYQHCYFDYDDSTLIFNNTIFILKKKRMIELGSNFAHVLHSPQQYAWGDKLITELAQFRVKDTTHNRVIGFASHTDMN